MTDVNVGARVSITGVPADWRWTGQIELYGDDAAEPQRLFPVQWIVLEPRVGLVPARARVVDVFLIGLGTTVLRKSMTVASERLDEDQETEMWVNLPGGRVYVPLPETDEVFARMTLTPAAGGAPPLPAVDSNIVRARFELAPER